MRGNPIEHSGSLAKNNKFRVGFFDDRTSLPPFPSGDSMKPLLPFALLTGLLLSACSSPAVPDAQNPAVTLSLSPNLLTAAGAATFTATASDNVGVTRVEFYDNGTLIANDDTAPYSITQNYTVSNNGTHTITARAYDAAGNKGEATGTFTVNIAVPDTQAPTLSLTATPASLTGAGTVTLKATASDDVAVTRVTFYRGETVLAEDTTAPYEFSAPLTATDNGTVTFRAVATDAAGNTKEATTTVTVNIDVTKPAISLTATPSTLDRPGDVTVTATALDDRGVTKVEFYDNGVLVGTDDSAPYTIVRSYTAAQNGTHTLTAKAFDAQGNTAEASTTVTVNADAVKPTVSVMAAPANLTYPGTVAFTATASDDRGVTKVEFYDNGVLIGSDDTAPYTASRSYTFADNGNHTIMVRAYDAQGNVGESSLTYTVAITDANEPNNSVAAASRLTVGTAVNGTIAGMPRDFDYFKFDAVAGEMLRLNVRSVSVDPNSTLDPYVMILMPDGKTVLEKDDDSGAGLESEIRFNAPVAGTYTAVVTSFDIHDLETNTDDRATNTYQILLTRR